MKLIILKENFKKGLSAVEKIITEGVNLPILKNILIKTLDNKIRVSATNLELAIEKYIPGKIITPGSLTVPFSTFYNIVANADTEKINLESKDNNLIIETDNYQAKIQGIPEDEFPIIPKIEQKEKYLEIDADILKDSLSEVITAAQISEIRPEISGILLDFQSTILKLVATDSFRLAEKTLYDNQFRTNFSKGFRIIIPLKTIQEIVRIFQNSGAVMIYIDSNQILFKNDEQELISRLIDGQYPDYEQIIPKKTDTEIVLNKDKLWGAVKLVSALSGKINDIKLTTKDKILEIYSSNQYLGENNYRIPVKINGSEFKEITFNWRYLIDGIKPVRGEDILLGINGDSKPTVIKSPKEASYFYILMPIKDS